MRRNHRLVLRADRGSVHGAGVVRLQRVLHQHLPVATTFDLVPPGADHVGKPIAAQLARQVAQIDRQRLRTGVEVQEHQPVPLLQPDRRQRVRGLVEPFAAFHGRRGEQRAVQPIRPGMIGAADRPRPSAAAQQKRPAMTAAIGERAQRASLVAHQDCWAADGFDGAVITRLRQFAGEPDEEPRSQMDVRQLGAEHLIGGVHLAPQSPRMKDRGRRGAGRNAQSPATPIFAANAGIRCRRGESQCCSRSR